MKSRVEFILFLSLVFVLCGFQSGEAGLQETSLQESRPEISQEELTAAVPELRDLHEVVYPLWHNAYPEKDYALIKELLPQAEALTAKLDAAKLPGILRDKQEEWDQNKNVLKKALLSLKMAAEAENEEEMLKQTEAFHAGFERLVRTIRPVIPELDAFHKELYKLYHYYAPEYDLERIRAASEAMKEKIVPLKQAKLPSRLADRQADFEKVVLALEAAVFELVEVSRKDNKEAVLQSVEKMHTAYQNTEHIFDKKNAYEGLPPYKNPTLSVEERIEDLVTRMTLEEKVSQMMNSAAAVERLDVPEYDWWNECLHGVARAGLATVFPQAIGLAATWDTDLMYRVATAISNEARAKHHEFLRRGKRGIYQGLTFWSPNINIFRDPRWGRGMETYGEDPYLTGRMGVAFVKGLQGEDPKYLKVVATPKHYAVHSGPEPDRHTFDARTDERDFRETYLPHFRMCFEEAGAFSVMCAYNRYMGEACCGSFRMLTDILRNEWGFEGYVVSDCGAIRDIFHDHKIVETSAQAAALAVKSGCDLNCGSQYQNLVAAVEQGLITEAEIDTAVRRLFRARVKLGMFDPPEMVSYAQIPYSVVDSESHRALALEATRKSIVLLKNENSLLPLKKDIGTIAVIGPNAHDVEVLLGNYNGNPSNPITPLRGIQEKVSEKTDVLYALGCDWAENLPCLEVVPLSAFTTEEGGETKQGLRGEYFDNRDFAGEPVFTRIDPNVDFNWWDGAPHGDFDDDNFGVRWTGKVVPPVSGTYSFGAEGFNGFRVFLDGRLIVQFNGRHHPRKTYEIVELDKGRAYDLRVEFFESSEDAHIRLLWAVPGRNLLEEAITAAERADVVILCLGLSPRLEGEEMRVPVDGFEGGDRLTIGLPAVQENLLKAIHALGKPVILVLLNGSALAVNWAAANIPAIVETWYPGQAAGEALADVLFGDTNPAGRLPVTFYRSVDQLPDFKDYNMKGHTYRYFEGEPLYPFGYGLSYTNFAYANLVVPKTVRAGENIPVRVEVQNTGDRAGEEVVQLYLTDIEASVPVPIRSLQAFRRIFLASGEKKTVNFTLTPNQLSLLDADFKRVVEPGIFEVAVGGKQPGFAGTADAATTQVLLVRFEVTGQILLLK